MWQEEQRLSRFDDGAVRMRRQNEAVHSNIAAARAQDVVRSRVDAYYDPSHPDADWSGLVENRGKKKADDEFEESSDDEAAYEVEETPATPK